MVATNVGLRFSGGMVIGRWNVPDPNEDPEKFNRVAEDIGFHIAMGISDGETGCFFITMPEEVGG